jgi:hypothetical protein
MVALRRVCKYSRTQPARLTVPGPSGVPTFGVGDVALSRVATSAVALLAAGWLVLLSDCAIAMGLLTVFVAPSFPVGLLLGGKPLD